MKKASDIVALKKFGINPKGLGCVMLNVEQLPVKDWLPAEWAYFPKDKEAFWIKGLDVESHFTLKYGFLFSAQQFPGAIDEVLEGTDITEVVIDYIDKFPTSVEGENYSCIIGRIVVTDEIMEAHNNLSLLPHIDTFPYEPHLTFGYVHVEHTEEAIDIIVKHTGTKPLKVTGLDYGR